MSMVYTTVSIVSFILCGMSLICAIACFFGFKIPIVFRDMKGSLEQKQIEEIRVKRSKVSSQKVAVNVFEELEKVAKPKTGNFRVNPVVTTSTVSVGSNPGTTVLNNNSKARNKDFYIEKNIIFVSTNEII